MKILITERFSPDGELKLKELGHEVKRAIDYAKPSLEEIAFAEVMIIRSKTSIYNRMLKQAKNLRLIITTTSGFDHIDLKACQAHNIKWAYTPSANRVSAGELTVALALQSLRRLHKIDLSHPIPLHRSHLMGSEIYGKTWGILGLGRVGSYVAQLLRGFGVDMLACDPYIKDRDFQKAHAERVSFAELFRCSDIVSIHVPKTDETQHFITLRALKDLGPQGLLINMARSHVISIDVLLQALREKRIGMVALDVFEHWDSQFLNFPNLLLSPHLGGNTYEALERASDETIQIIQDFSQ